MHSSPRWRRCHPGWRHPGLVKAVKHACHEALPALLAARRWLDEGARHRKTAAREGKDVAVWDGLSLGISSKLQSSADDGGV